MKHHKAAKIEIDLEYFAQTDLSEIVKYLENVDYINVKKLIINYIKEKEYESSK